MSNEPTIIFEDEHLMVLNKPAGLVVHADGRTEEDTLTDWVMARHPDIVEVGGLHTLDSGRYVARHGIVHRLDRDTSGVIVIAKDDPTFFALQRQFIDRSTEKVYHAVVHGIFEEKEGVIDKAIGRNREDFRQWAVAPHARGTLRPAMTQYRVIAEHDGASFIELAPKTGRTHQLRVHLSSVGHPIIADPRYGIGREPMFGFTRLALHAKKLTLDYAGKRQTFEASYPSDFTYAKESFGL